MKKITAKKTNTTKNIYKKVTKYKVTTSSIVLINTVQCISLHTYLAESCLFVFVCEQLCDVMNIETNEIMIQCDC